MQTSESCAEIFGALAKAQGQFGNVVRDLVASVQSTKGSYQYSYADLGACLDVVRKPLADNGLAVLQSCFQSDGDIHVETRLAHGSGEWIDYGVMVMTPQRPGPQAVGSCITYARRYALAAALGIAQTDDDAQEAESSNGKEAPKKLSMADAIKHINATAKDYAGFVKEWDKLDPALRKELASKKPKQIEIWKGKFPKDVDQNQGQKADSNPDGDRKAATSQSG